MLQSLSRLVVSSNLILVYRTGEPVSWASKYNNSVSITYIPYTEQSSEVYSKVYNVSIAYSASSPYTKANMAKMITAQSVKFKVEVQDKLLNGTTLNPFSVRTHVWNSATSLSDNGYATESSAFANETPVLSSWTKDATVFALISS